MKIAEVCNNVNDIQYFTVKDVKKKIKYALIPESETWRVGVGPYVSTVLCGHVLLTPIFKGERGL